MQGFDVMHLQMPFHGCNAQDPLHPISHQWFAQFAGKDGINSDTFPFMRFFVEPVWLTINYAKSIGMKILLWLDFPAAVSQRMLLAQSTRGLDCPSQLLGPFRVILLIPAGTMNNFATSHGQQLQITLRSTPLHPLSRSELKYRFCTSGIRAVFMDVEDTHGFKNTMSLSELQDRGNL